MAQRRRTTRGITSQRSLAGRIPDFEIKQWEGLNTEIKDLTVLVPGASPDSSNWVTGRYKDHIELRGGYALFGNTRAGVGRVSGLGVGVRYDGIQVPFFTVGRKLKYYDYLTKDVIETGTDLFPTGAASDDFSVGPYQNLAGSFIYCSSPNSSIYKVHTANPGSAVDQQMNTYRGNFKVGQSRMFLWNRKDNYGGKDQTGVYLSYIDKVNLGSYTEVSAETHGTGDGSTKTFTGTLAFKAAGAKRTCMYVRIGAPIDAGVSVTGISKATQAVVTVASHTYVIGDTVIIQGAVGMTQINNLIALVVATTATTITLNVDSTSFTVWSSAGKIYKAELLSDDRNGAMTSIAGGTGTINYATGVYSVTFNTAPTNTTNIDADYYWEDSTVQGISDFSFSGSRTAGQGNVFRQDDGGGNTQAIFPFGVDEYCFHTQKIWDLNIPTTDTGATNLQYRSGIGIPYFRAACPTGDGISIIDNSNPSKPRFRALQYSQSLQIPTVVPVSLSDQLDLSTFGFDQAVVYRWSDYDILACKPSVNGVVQPSNGVMFIRNRYSGVWDKLDFAVSCLEQYNGGLIAGDSLTQNLLSLFDGFVDDDSIIGNFWKSGQLNLNIPGLKKFYRLVVRGLIQKDQKIDISLSYDGGAFNNVFTVDGRGSYVDSSRATTVGSATCGSKVVGGGGNSLLAYPFEVDIPIASDIFEYVSIQYQATNIGYCQIDKTTWKDIRYKGRKNLPSQTL